MKHFRHIFIPGLALAFIAYLCFYIAATQQSRTMMQCSAPELAWLQQEFKPTDAEFNRLSALHEVYRPQCRENCRRIAQNQAEIKSLLDQTNTLTPQIEQKLADAAQIRLDCQKMMLTHFLAVSKTLPPEQRRRYLNWVETRTLLSGPAMKDME